MTTCSLIGKYGYYMQLDIETVRCILLYEQLRHSRLKRDEIRDSDGFIHCRRCGVVLAKPKAKRGDQLNTVLSVSLSGGESGTTGGGEK